MLAIVDVFEGLHSECHNMLSVANSVSISPAQAGLVRYLKAAFVVFRNLCFSSVVINLLIISRFKGSY